jgi:hypothetical protein
MPLGVGECLRSFEWVALDGRRHELASSHKVVSTSLSEIVAGLLMKKSFLVTCSQGACPRSHDCSVDCGLWYCKTIEGGGSNNIQKRTFWLRRLS